VGCDPYVSAIPDPLPVGQVAIFQADSFYDADRENAVGYSIYGNYALDIPSLSTSEERLAVAPSGGFFLLVGNTGHAVRWPPARLAAGSKGEIHTKFLYQKSQICVIIKNDCYYDARATSTSDVNSLFGCDFFYYDFSPTFLSLQNTSKRRKAI
jgi:hypothetical protein